MDLKYILLTVGTALLILIKGPAVLHKNTSQTPIEEGGIKSYQKERDHAFVIKLVEEYFPEDAQLYPDLDSKTLLISVPAPTEQDRAALLSALNTMKIPESALVNDQDADSVQFKVDKQLIYLYYDHQKPVGFIRAFITGDIAGSVVDIAVLPESRGKGIGVKLLEHLITELKKLGVQWVTLQTDPTNTSAQRMYEKAGFTLLKTVGNNAYFIYEMPRN